MLLHRSISRRFKVLTFLTLCLVPIFKFVSGGTRVALGDDKSPSVVKKDPAQKDDSEEIQDLDADSSDFSEELDRKIEKEETIHSNKDVVSVPVSDDN